MNLSSTPPVNYLHLSLHLVNGRTDVFVQTEPDKAQQVLSHVRPDRLFTEKVLIFQGPADVSVVVTESIERVDLRSEPLPAWTHTEPMASVAEISEEDFQRIVQRVPPEPPKVMGRVVPQPPAEIGAAAELRSGAFVYFRMVPQRGKEKPSERPQITGADIRQFLTHIFTRPVIFGQMEEEQGIFLLNPANVLRLRLSPSPDEAISGAWAMAMREE